MNLLLHKGFFQQNGTHQNRDFTTKTTNYKKTMNQRSNSKEFMKIVKCGWTHITLITK